MIRRTFDVERVNYLVNHKEVRPLLGFGEKYIDLSEAVQDDANHFLDAEYGGFACCWSAPQTYEIHTFILPEGRGKWAYQLARAGRDYMQEIGATHLWTRVHPDFANVKFFTLRAGFRPAGHRTTLGIAYDLFDWRP